MADIQDIIDALGDGKDNAIHASGLESTLGMDVGHTQEPTRDLIRKALINNELPIGSIPNSGYFLIHNEQEYKEVIANLEDRMQGLRRRIEAITRGWEQRKASRAAGRNWPK